MHVITITRLVEFGRRHPEATPSLRAWLGTMRRRRYADSHGIKRDFAEASFLGDTRVVFNIAGNKYRLVVDVLYRVGRVYVRHIVTHEEYNRLTRANAL